MADLFPSLTRGLLPRLGQEPASTGGFRTWLSSGSYAPDPSAAGPGLVLDRVDVKEIVRYVAFDYERFALSSRESFSVACLECANHNLAGWPVLKLYYAAFFAAHSIVRSQGGGVVALDRDHVNRLNAVTRLIDQDSPSLTAGMYVYNIDYSRNAIVRLEPASTTASGVHDAFWRYFCSFLEAKAGMAVESGAPDSAEYVAGADELVEAIQLGDSRSKAWFSMVRNEINYQHKHDVWFPLKKDGRVLQALVNSEFSASKSFRMDVSQTKNPIGSFVNTARYISCLNIELADYVSNRSSAGRAFGQKWRRLSHIVNPAA